MRTRRVVVALGAVLLGACAQSDIAAPSGPEEAPSLFAASQGNPWVYHVTGGGSGMVENTGLLTTGRVNVRQATDGTISGEFEFHSRFPQGQDVDGQATEVHIVAEADCMIVEGNTAWISGKMTKIKKFDFPAPVPPQLGNPYMTIVEVRGPSDAGAWFSPPRFVGAVDCNDRPPIPALPPTGRINGAYTIHAR
ncbi:MAG: hypothetical protein R3E10_14230 [Gemmatimonadota bacterium]